MIYYFSQVGNVFEGVSNCPIHYKNARKIFPLLAEIARVLACLCSPKFCECMLSCSDSS